MNRYDETLYPQFIDLCVGKSVLEVGSRIVSPNSTSKRDLFPQSQFTGFDLYKDDNTDVTGDAHRLSKNFNTPFDAVFSLSVLEHLAAPWIFAYEVNRVLVTGGVTFHATHFAWPEHELPWDFYRFSDYGLQAIFSRQMGFEILGAAVYAPGQMRFVDKNHAAQHPDMPKHRIWGGSCVLARKTANLPKGLYDWVNIDSIYPEATKYPEAKT